jgi:predicted DNA-binding transcriptional regulator AlpA
MNPTQLLSQQQLAQALGVSISTMQRLRKEGIVPPPLKFMKRGMRWSPSVLEQIVINSSPPVE